MKGIVFTLDALFALMIAAAGITVVIYFTYSAPTPAIVQYSSASAFVNEMASAKLSSITGLPLVQAIVNQSQAYNQSWPQLLQDAQNGGGNGNGPSLYTVAYTVNVPDQIMNGTMAAAYGNIYFGAGNIIYAINATTGNVIWKGYAPYNAAFAGDDAPEFPEYETPTINATAVYDGMLIFTTTANTVALNAHNGSVIWSVPVPYGTGLDQEPDDDEPVMHLAISNGKVITGSSDDTLVPLDKIGYAVYGLFANNGTIASLGTAIAPSAAEHAPHTTIYNGGIISVLLTLTETSNNFLGFELLTPIYNQTYGAGSLSTLIPTTSTSTMSDVAVYGNVFAIGEGDEAYLYSVSNVLSPISSTNLGDPITGVTSDGGRFAFQYLNGAALYNSAGTQIWSQTTSSLSAIQNSTPVQSAQNIYSIWSNGWVSEQNLSTGKFSQSTQMPFSTTQSSAVSINPNIMLAYGKLYATEGDNLIAFGTCQANSNASILSALGTMYINNQGSCADFIVSSLQNTENTSFTINNKSVITASRFNGASSVATVPYVSSLNVNKPLTISLWFSSNTAAGSSFDSELMGAVGGSGSSAGIFNVQLVGGSASTAKIKGSIQAGSATQSFSYPLNALTDRWYNLVGVFSSSGWTLYVNGNAISGTYSGGGAPNLLGGSSNLQFGAGSAASNFLGSIAGVQIYNTTLNAQQAGQIYQDGISGGPVDSPNLVAWFPLAGDANGYSSGHDFPGYDTQVKFLDASYTAPGVLNAHSVASQTLPTLLYNYSTGNYKLYNVGIYSWK